MLCSSEMLNISTPQHDNPYHIKKIVYLDFGIVRCRNNENIVEIKYDGEFFYYGKGKALNYVSNPNIVKSTFLQLFTSEFSNFSSSFLSIIFIELAVHPENSLNISCSIPK